ncbi:MAG: hypothetical protein AAF633_22255, partial [Chloroflexota bacterium]
MTKRVAYLLFMMIALSVFAVVRAAPNQDVLIYDGEFKGDWTAWGWGVDSFSYGSGAIKAKMLAPGAGIYLEIPDWEYREGVQAGPEDVLTFEYKEVASTTSVEVQLIDRDNIESRSI